MSTYKISLLVSINFLIIEVGRICQQSRANSLMIISLILMTSFLGYSIYTIIWEVWCWSFLGFKGFINSIVLDIHHYWKTVHFHQIQIIKTLTGHVQLCLTLRLPLKWLFRFCSTWGMTSLLVSSLLLRCSPKLIQHLYPERRKSQPTFLWYSFYCLMNNWWQISLKILHTVFTQNLWKAGADLIECTNPVLSI